jgi:magnesium transporter
MGHWQSFDEIKVSQKLKVSVAKKICSQEQPMLTDTIYIIDHQTNLLGGIPINQLLLLDDGKPLKEVIYHETSAINASKNIGEAADEVILSGKAVLSIIDDEGCLTGRLDLHYALNLKNNKQIIK